MRLFLLFSALLCLAAPVAAQTPDGYPPSMDQVGLAWDRQPSIERMRRLYPRTALREGIGRGLARLSCTSLENGRVRCTVLEETPAELGFGTAGVQVMDRAVVRATDGQPLAGRTFLFTLRFGYWPPRLRPDIYHPVNAGLRWRRSPNLGDWNGNDSPPFGGEAVMAFDCTARADGSLDCREESRDPDYIDEMVAAMLTSLAEARVERIDGGSPEGVRFRWGMRYRRID